MRGALPVARLTVDGVTSAALIDTGCTKSIAHASVCRTWQKLYTSVRTLNGERYVCDGVGTVTVRTSGGGEAPVEVLVTLRKPLNFSFILGMNGIKALQGVMVSANNEVSFGTDIAAAGLETAAVVGAVSAAGSEDKDEPCSTAGTVPLGSPSDLPADTDGDSCQKGPPGPISVEGKAPATDSARVIEEKDFLLAYDDGEKKWTVTWKWDEGAEPPQLMNSTAEYRIPQAAREAYDDEVTHWIADGWLVPYNEDLHGPVMGTIPLMAIVQPNKDKVRPVMDFRELNSYLSLHTADADVCGDKIREWRRGGRDISLIDLRKAYLQVHVHPSLWRYQTVVYKGDRFCMTRMMFGLNIAPIVMKTLLSAVLSWDERIKRATSPYLDDIWVDESVASAGEVEDHLRRHGLTSKPPERVSEGARVLGMRVWGERDSLVWKRDNDLGELPEQLTRRTVFSLCGRLTAHLPVCGWLRVAASYLKRRVNAVTRGWDDEVTDPELRAMVEEVMQRVRLSDPARGRWDVSGSEAVVWVDASSLALGVVLEMGGEVVEDACWLRQNDSTHINLAELDAVVRGVNLAVMWDVKTVTVKSDSRTVCHWLADMLSGRARLKTRAASEMLIRRRIDTVKELVSEYGLNLTVEFVTSADNRADALTRVPRKWLAASGEEVACGAVETSPLQQPTADEIAAIHHTSGHPGIKRTLLVCRKRHPAVTRRQVQTVVKECQACQSIDPAPVRWAKGSLSVTDCWSRVSMDICHVGSEHYLTLIDCGPSRYTIWRRLRHQDSESIIRELEAVFCERGAPEELLTDNAPSFRSAVFREFASRWDMAIRYRCAHVPSGNGISERCHRSIKTIVARKGCTVAEAAYRYNVMPRDADPESAPVSQLFRYRVRQQGIDSDNSEPVDVECRFQVGDRVWVRDVSRRCDVPSSIGTVTKIVSPQNVEVDGMSRHVRDLRRVIRVEQLSTPPVVDPRRFRDARSGDDVPDGEYLFARVPVGRESARDETNVVRRGDRERSQRQLCQYDDL